MQAHNPRKRRAENELLPLHAAKQPRTSPLPGELSARWIRVGAEAMGLFRDTSVAIFGALTTVVSYVFGEESAQPHLQSQRQPENQIPGSHPSYPISPPSSNSPLPPNKTVLKPSGSGDTVIEPQNVLPSPPLSTSSNDGSMLPASNEAGPSKRRPTVTFQSPLLPPRSLVMNQVASTSRQPLRSTSNTIGQPASDPVLPTPPPSNTSASSLSPTTNFVGLHPQIDQALAAAINRQTIKPKSPRKIKHREHIFHNKFKAGVKDQLRKTREDMERELYVLRRRTSGYTSVFLCLYGG